MTLDPLRHARDAADAYHAAQTKSLFRLRSDRSRLPSGWVLVSGDWRGDGTVLIAESDSGVSDRYALPVQAGHAVLLCLPRRVSRLTLSAPNATTDSLPCSMQILQLGRVRTAYELLYAYVAAVLNDPAMLGHFMLRAADIVRRHGVGGLHTALVGRFPRAVQGGYAEWVRRYDTLSPDDATAIRAHIDRLGSRPRLSIVMLVEAGAPHLDAAIRSVRDQWYGDWDLVLAVTERAGDACRAIVERQQDADQRVQAIAAPTPTQAINRALRLVDGAFVAIVTTDGGLAPHALYMMALEIIAHPDVGMLYSDEDCIDADGQRHSPSFKPEWNPDLLLSQPYVGQLVAYRADVLRQVGGWREIDPGAQQWDLALRVSEEVGEDCIRRIPHVLYHGYAAVGASHLMPPTAAVRDLLQDHFAQRGVAVQLTQQPSGTWRVQYPIDPVPLVSIIIPTHNGVRFLRRCIDGVLGGTDYPAIEVLLVDNRSDDPETLQYLADLESDSRVRVLHFNAPFNFSAINNFAVRQANGAILALLNDDVEPITRDWLSEMVGHALRRQVGAVGAQLHYPDGRIQHAGMVLGVGGLAGHAYRGFATSCGCGMQRTQPQAVSAVTAACLVLRRDVYREVGGLDESLAVAFNDVDLCLRLGQRGYRVLWSPHARLYHRESATRGLDRTAPKARRFRGEEATMRRRWGALLDDDPAYSPNLTLTDASFSLAFPPRVVPPWRPSTLRTAQYRG